MTSILTSRSSSSAFNTLRLIARTSPSTLRRALSTLPQNPHIYVHEVPSSNPSKPTYLYTYLPTTPPNPHLAIATSPTNPPTPDTLIENPAFLDLLHHTISETAVKDPVVQSQAALYLSQAGSALGSGGVFFPQQQQASRQRGNRSPNQNRASRGDGAGGASAQGGMGGAGRGGYIHVADERNPADWGRTAWPEDILGSLELDGEGRFVDGTGRYQRSGTYRVLTMEGFLGLSDFLRERVRERCAELEVKMKGGS